MRPQSGPQEKKVVGSGRETPLFTKWDFCHCYDLLSSCSVLQRNLITVSDCKAGKSRCGGGTRALNSVRGSVGDGGGEVGAGGMRGPMGGRAGPGARSSGTFLRAAS